MAVYVIPNGEINTNYITSTGNFNGNHGYGTDFTWSDSTSSDNELDTTEPLTLSFLGFPFTETGNFLGTFNFGGVDYPVFARSSDFTEIVGIHLDSTTYPTFASLGPLNTSNLMTDYCFAEGTRIATPLGFECVENLKIGAPILAADERIIQVKWVGRQVLHKLLAGTRMQPVRIRSGAFGVGLPERDLTVTSDHGMIIDGLVINASALVNGTSVDWVPLVDLPDCVTYYHIETEDHEVILANGTPAETFVDARSRSNFDNYQEYLELYGAERLIREMNWPRISSRRLLPDAIKVRLGIVDEVIEFDRLLSA